MTAMVESSRPPTSCSPTAPSPWSGRCAPTTVQALHELHDAGLRRGDPAAVLHRRPGTPPTCTSTTCWPTTRRSRSSPSTTAGWSGSPPPSRWTEHRCEVAFLVADDARGLGRRHAAARAPRRARAVARHHARSRPTCSPRTTRCSRCSPTPASADQRTSTSARWCCRSAPARPTSRTTRADAREFQRRGARRSGRCCGPRRWPSSAPARTAPASARRCSGRSSPAASAARWPPCTRARPTLAGVPAYPSLARRPRTGRPRRHLRPGQPRSTTCCCDAAAAGVRAAVIVSSGFGELGAEGATPPARQSPRPPARTASGWSDRTAWACSATTRDVRLNATFHDAVPPTGGLAVASQSGGVGIVLMDLARELGLGVHTFVSLGNKADVSSNDLLAAWYDDPDVTAAALYLESFGNAAKFARFARRFAERKPLLAVVGGRSAGGSRAGASHTAAAASPGVGVDALFAQAGVIGCRDAEDLARTAMLLAEQPLPSRSPARDPLQRRGHGRARRRRRRRGRPGRPGVLRRRSRQRLADAGPRHDRHHATRSTPAPASPPAELAALLDTVLASRRGRRRCSSSRSPPASPTAARPWPSWPGCGPIIPTSRSSPSRWAVCRQRDRASTRSPSTGPPPPPCAPWAARCGTPSGWPSSASAPSPDPDPAARSGCRARARRAARRRADGRWLAPGAGGRAARRLRHRRCSGESAGSAAEAAVVAARGWASRSRSRSPTRTSCTRPSAAWCASACAPGRRSGTPYRRLRARARRTPPGCWCSRWRPAPRSPSDWCATRRSARWSWSPPAGRHRRVGRPSLPGAAALALRRCPGRPVAPGLAPVGRLPRSGQGRRSSPGGDAGGPRAPGPRRSRGRRARPQPGAGRYRGLRRGRRQGAARGSGRAGLRGATAAPASADHGRSVSSSGDRWGGQGSGPDDDLREVRAVDGVSLEVGESEFVGSRGPDGAGRAGSWRQSTGCAVPTPVSSRCGATGCGRATRRCCRGWACSSRRRRSSNG